MNKKSFVFVLLILYLFPFIISCSDSSYESCANSLESRIDLPSTLFLDTELPSDYPNYLSSYYVQWINIDTKTALSLLMNSTDSTHEKWAEGDCYQLISENGDKQLVIYNGILHGGFNYGCFIPSMHESLSLRNDFINLTKTDEPNTSAQANGNLNMLPFPEDKELSFAAVSDVSAEIESLLNKLGILHFTFSSIQVRDVETFNYNRNIFNEAQKKFAESPGKNLDGISISRSYTDLDEDYYVTLSETIEGIPFSPTMNWVSDKGLIHQGTDVSLIVEYGKDGISSFKVENYYDILEPIISMDIISPEQALQVYLDDYNKSIHLIDTKITKIELNYVVIISDNVMIARPCWMIHTERQATDQINLYTNEPFYEYPLYAISADTGVILTSNEDMR